MGTSCCINKKDEKSNLTHEIIMGPDVSDSNDNSVLHKSSRTHLPLENLSASDRIFNSNKCKQDHSSKQTTQDCLILEREENKIIVNIPEDDAEYEKSPSDIIIHNSSIPMKHTNEMLSSSSRDNQSKIAKKQSIQSTTRIIKKSTSNFNAGFSNFRCENTGNLEDSYELLEAIGKGAFGIVRVVLDRSTNEKRAVKIIDKTKCDITVAFSEEISILQKLDHPNVVRFFEFFQDAKNFYLVTEYCKGGDLLTKLSEERTFSERMASNILKQVFSAVEYCHRNNIVHRYFFNKR